MQLHRVTPMLAAVVLVGCGPDATTAVEEELLLARQAELIAQDEARDGVSYASWLARLFEALRTTEDPEALALLEQARSYREQARLAWEAGDVAAAREYHRLAFRAVLGAVLEVYPHAPARTGFAVDRALERIEAFLRDRPAPKIRRILRHVRDLRTEAAGALEAGDPVTALALNLRGLHILHRLVYHVRDRIEDHDRVADAEMHALAY